MVNLLWILVASIAFAEEATAPTVIADKYEREVLKRTDLQIQMIVERFQTELQKATADIVKEANEIYGPLCKKAEVSLDQCQIDRISGVVSKKTAQPARTP